MSTDCHNMCENDTFVDFYKVLDCKRTATFDELKKNYQKYILVWHPDKVSTDSNSEKKFITVQKAWSVLRDPQKRKEYDALLMCYEHNDCFLYNTVSLSEMDHMDHGVYTFQCRCSGTYVLEVTDVMPSQVIISCDECSLSILVNLDKT